MRSCTARVRISSELWRTSRVRRASAAITLVAPGSGFDFSYGRNQTRQLHRLVFDGGDPLRRTREGIKAKVHGRCSGVIGAAQECELQSALSDDGFDGGEGLMQCIQNRALFDVKLKVAEGIVFQLGPRKIAGIQSEVFDCLSHRNAARVASGEEFLDRVCRRARGCQ